eukprot:tig00000157_g9723.t1
MSLQAQLARLSAKDASDADKLRSLFETLRILRAYRAFTELEDAVRAHVSPQAASALVGCIDAGGTACLLVLQLLALICTTADGAKSCGTEETFAAITGVLHLRKPEFERWALETLIAFEEDRQALRLMRRLGIARLVSKPLEESPVTDQTPEAGTGPACAPPQFNPRIAELRRRLARALAPEKIVRQDH